MDAEELDQLLKVGPPPRGAQRNDMITRALDYLGRSTTSIDDDWAGFNLDDPKEREAAERAIFDVFNDFANWADSHPLMEWLNSEIAFQAAKKRMGFKRWTQERLKLCISDEIQRKLDASKVDWDTFIKNAPRSTRKAPSDLKEEYAKQMEHYRHLKAVPLRLEFLYTSLFNWSYGIGKAARNYLSGSGYDFSFNISHEVEKARNGLRAYLEVTESEVARYYGELIDPSGHFFPGSPLDLPTETASDQLRTKLRQLDILQDSIDSIKVVKNRSKTAQERIFFIDLAHHNLRHRGNVCKRAVFAFLDFTFLNVIPDEKTIERACNLAELQHKALRAIREALVEDSFRR